MAILVVMLAVSGCSTLPTHGDGRIIWRDELEFVRVESAPPGAHPNGGLEVAAAQLRRVLAGLRFRDESGDVHPVFTADGLDSIVGPLTTGLARLKPGQDLTFAVTQNSTSGDGMVGFFQDATLTTGRLFVKGDGLNVIFGRLHAPFEDAYRATGTPPRRTPGRRGERADRGWAVLETEYVDYASDTREDWIVIEPVAWKTVRAIPQVDASAVGPITAPDAAAPANPYYQRTRARLMAIKRLRDDGLISEQEYRDMRARILERLAEPDE